MHSSLDHKLSSLFAGRSLEYFQRRRPTRFCRFQLILWPQENYRLNVDYTTNMSDLPEVLQAGYVD